MCHITEKQGEYDENRVMVRKKEEGLVGQLIRSHILFLLSRSHSHNHWLDLPSLFQRTEAGPLLGFGVKAFNRVKQLPVGAPTYGIDLLVHGGVAADLREKTNTAVQNHGMWRRSTVRET